MTISKEQPAAPALFIENESGRTATRELHFPETEYHTGIVFDDDLEREIYWLNDAALIREFRQIQTERK